MASGHRTGLRSARTCPAPQMKPAVTARIAATANEVSAIQIIRNCVSLGGLWWLIRVLGYTNVPHPVEISNLRFEISNQCKNNHIYPIRGTSFKNHANG